MLGELIFSGALHGLQAVQLATSASCEGCGLEACQRVLLRKGDRGVSQDLGYPFGGLHNKDYSIGGLWGPPYLGKRKLQ